MPNRLELPDDLASLIEKREREEDRREAERRATEGAAGIQGEDRRATSDRRTEARREDDPAPGAP